MSGIGIGVAPGAGKSAALSYVTVQNTGGHGIAVSNGTLAIGEGVTVSGAGTGSKRRDGLNIAGGLVNITVTSGQAPSTFNNNSQHGIYVTGAGGLSTVNGFVAWQNAQNGLRLYGGEKVKVRNSVFLANGLNGVYVTFYDATAAGNDLSQIDLGTAADGGRNVVQAAVGSMPDLAGLCVQMASGRGTLTLSARGNLFAGPIDCTSSTAPIVRSTICNGFVDLGVVSAAGTTVNVDVATCQ
jgi:hypothetical protein